MLYGKKTPILEEVTSTLLSNEIKKNAESREADRIRFGGHGKEKKRRRKDRSGLVRCMSLLSRERSLKE